MFAIIGLVVVFGSVIGGFLLEKGNPLVLMQPCELLIIFGSALGTMLVANSPETILSIAKSLFGVTGGSPFTKGYYLESRGGRSVWQNSRTMWITPIGAPLS